MANQINKRNEAVIYVAHDETTVMGYYTLSTCQIQQADDTQLLKKQSPHNPIPCVLLGRLATDKAHQGKGVGSDLLLHAMQTVRRLADNIGMAYIVVDAKDDTAKSFYQYYGFKELTSDPLRLCYAVKDIPSI